jgi:hypothetical protein
MDAEMKERLKMAGLSAADLAWFESFGADDKAVPPPRPDEIADYRRREAGLNASISALTFSERGVSTEGKLAAAIGARIADASEPEEDE